MLVECEVKVRHFPVQKKRPYRQMKLLLLLPTEKEAVVVTASAVAVVALAVAMFVVAILVVVALENCHRMGRGKLGRV
jgi:hypothetical protein